MAISTGCRAGLSSRYDRSDLAANRALLVSGGVSTIAVFTDRLSGPPVFVDNFALAADVTNTLHNLTPIRLSFNGSKRSPAMRPFLFPRH